MVGFKNGQEFSLLSPHLTQGSTEPLFRTAGDFCLKQVKGLLFSPNHPDRKWVLQSLLLDG